MPQPTLGDVHVDRPLTNVSIAFRQEAEKYIAGKVFPEITVTKVSDLFFVYSRKDWNRLEMQKRGLSEESAGGGWTQATQRYACEQWSLHKDIDDRIQGNADQPLDPRRDASVYLTDQGLKRRDSEWATNYFQTGVWGTDLTGVAADPGVGEFLQWDQAGSDPVEDLSEQNEQTEEATGFELNKVVFGAKVWRTIKNHPLIIDRIKGGAMSDKPAVVTKQLVAALLEVDEVLVARGIVNTAAEGAAEASEYIVDPKATLMVYAAPSPSLLMPSAGYTFQCNALPGMGAGQRIKSFREEKLQSERTEIDMDFDMNLVAPELAVFFDQSIG